MADKPEFNANLLSLNHVRFYSKNNFLFKNITFSLVPTFVEIDLGQPYLKERHKIELYNSEPPSSNKREN